MTALRAVSQPGSRVSKSMKVKDLIVALKKTDQEAEVRAKVTWASGDYDCEAYSDKNLPLEVRLECDRVIIEGHTESDPSDPLGPLDEEDEELEEEDEEEPEEEPEQLVFAELKNCLTLWEEKFEWGHDGTYFDSRVLLLENDEGQHFLMVSSSDGCTEDAVRLTDDNTITHEEFLAQKDLDGLIEHDGYGIRAQDLAKGLGLRYDGFIR